MSSSALSAMLQLQGLPPLPRSLTGYSPAFTQHQHPHFAHPQPQHIQPIPNTRNELLQNKPTHGLISHAHLQQHGRPSPPVPPPRPTSRKSSSSGSSFRASPDHLMNRSTAMVSGSTTEVLRSSPRSLSSSPHSPQLVDSGIGRSSADSFNEPRAFVRVVKSPPIISTRLDAQLTQLKNDMHHLRQQDMALLGHLLQIHQGIQELRSVLIPPPQPAPSSVIPMFHPSSYGGSGSGSTSSSSRHSKHKTQQQQSSSQSSRLSILSSGASKLFSRRSSSGDKLMAEAMAMSAEMGPGPSHYHTQQHQHQFLRRREEDESDSLSSFEFGDV